MSATNLHTGNWNHGILIISRIATTLRKQKHRHHPVQLDEHAHKHHQVRRGNLPSVGAFAGDVAEQLERVPRLPWHQAGACRTAWEARHGARQPGDSHQGRELLKTRAGRVAQEGEGLGLVCGGNRCLPFRDQGREAGLANASQCR